MRRAALVGTIISAAILVFGLMLVPIVGANQGAGPAFQGDTTATATATADAGATPTTGGAGGATTVTATAAADGDTTGGAAATATVTATAAAAGDTTGGGATADETATAGAAGGGTTGGGTTDGTSPGNLPNTGANDGPSAVMLTIAVALLIFGATAVATLLARRRGTQA